MFDKVCWVVLVAAAVHGGLHMIVWAQAGFEVAR